MRSLQKSGKERRCFPLALRDLSTRRSPFSYQAAQPGHVGLGPRLVDEDQTPGIDAALIGSPSARDDGLCPHDPVYAATRVF